MPSSLPEVTLAAAAEFVRPVTRLLTARGLTVGATVSGHIPPAATEGPAHQTDDALPGTPAPELFPAGRTGILVCVCYPRRIAAEALRGFSVALNFHPAPLPDLRGIHVFELAIAEDRPDFAVTCHHLTPDLDSGDLIDSAEVARRPDDTAVALAGRAFMANMMLVDRVVRRLVETWPEPLPGTPQGPGVFAGRRFTRERCWPRAEDDDRTLDRKMRAVCFDGRTARFGDAVFPLGPDGVTRLRAWLAEQSPALTAV